MNKKGFHVEGLDSELYDGDVIDIYEYDGHFILKYGWAMLNNRPYEGWYLRSLSNPDMKLQAASVNLSLVVVHSRNDRPDDLKEQFHLRHS